MYTWDMREAMKTYARSPVHSLCALCPSPPKDQLTKTANLDTQRGKSSQKHPGDMRDAIKTYARRTVHSLCNLCFSPPPPGYWNLQSKISTSVPANLPGAINYDRKQGLCKQVSARCCYSVIYHRKCMFRRVHQPTHELQFAMESQDSGTCQPAKCWKLH